MDCRPIGTISTPLSDPDDAPRQGGRTDIEGRIEVAPEYADGLTNFDAEWVVVVWFADRADRSVRSYEREVTRGIFTTRSPERPNPICLTTCEVLDVEPAALAVRGVDMLHGTPLLDLKPRVDVGE